MSAGFGGPVCAMRHRNAGGCSGPTSVGLAHTRLHCHASNPLTPAPAACDSNCKALHLRPAPRQTPRQVAQTPTPLCPSSISPDYIQTNLNPNFDRTWQAGWTTNHLDPSFASKQSTVLVATGCCAVLARPNLANQYMLLNLLHMMLRKSLCFKVSVDDM